jgi:hypothetical protein
MMRLLPSVISLALGTMCGPEYPREGFWDVQLIGEPVGQCVDRNGRPFEPPERLEVVHSDLFERFTLYRAGGYALSAGRLYGSVDVERRSFNDYGESPKMMEVTTYTCRFFLDRDLSGRFRNRNNMAWTERAAVFAAEQSGSRLVDCTFPLDDPDIGEGEALRRLPADISVLPYDEAKAAWTARFATRDAPCVEERSYSATFFADELPERPPRPGRSPEQYHSSLVRLMAHLPPPGVTDRQFDAERRWLVEGDGFQPKYFKTEGSSYEWTSVPTGPIKVSLEQRMRQQGEEPNPWLPYGPTKTVLAGSMAVTMVHAYGYEDPPREADVALRLDTLPNFPMAEVMDAPLTPDWDFEEQRLTRLVHAHPDAEYAVIDLWMLDDACRPLSSAPTHPGLTPGGFITDLIWPMGQPIVIGVDAGADGTIDHCFRLPARVLDGDGGPIVAFRRMWRYDDDRHIPAAIVIPYQDPWLVAPSE